MESCSTKAMRHQPHARAGEEVIHDATVAVFTFERGPLANLDEAARLLAEGADVVLVDASESSEAADAHRREAEARGIRVLRTPGAGLAAQRNAAVRDARAPVVVFLDDDCLPREGWLRRLLAAVDAGAAVATARIVTPPEAAGPFDAFFDQDRGRQSRTFTRRDLRVLPPLASAFRTYAGSRGLAPWAVGTGSSFATRTDVARDVPFREDLGVGTPAASGEDTDFFLRVLAAGHEIRYEADAVVAHHHVRRTEADFLRTAYGYAVGGRAVLVRNVRVNPAYAFVIAARPVQLLAVGALRRATGDAPSASMCWSALRGWVGLGPPRARRRAAA